MMTWDSVCSTKCTIHHGLKRNNLGEQISEWSSQFGKEFHRQVPQVCIVQAVLTQLRVFSHMSWKQFMPIQII